MYIVCDKCGSNNIIGVIKFKCTAKPNWFKRCLKKKNIIWNRYKKYSCQCGQTWEIEI